MFAAGRNADPQPAIEDPALVSGSRLAELPPQRPNQALGEPLAQSSPAASAIEKRQDTRIVAEAAKPLDVLRQEARNEGPAVDGAEPFCIGQHIVENIGGPHLVTSILRLLDSPSGIGNAGGIIL